MKTPTTATCLMAAMTAVLSHTLSAQPDFGAICGKLPATKREHPYLLFSAREKPGLKAAIDSSRESSEIFDRILSEGKRYLYAPALPAPPPRTLHSRFTGNDEYGEYVSGLVDAGFTLAFLYQMTGDARYAARAYTYADAICGLESWVKSAHTFEIIYSRVWPYNVKDDQVVFSYDITASHVTGQLALMYDWLYPALSRRERDRIRGALLEKAVTRVRGSYEFHWWATAYRCNWSGICHSGLGLAALALLNEDPQLTDVIARASEGVWNMLNNLGEDGGWQEGRGYWSYALSGAVPFMDAVKRATGGKIDLFAHRNLKEHPLDFALFGLTAGFGDGSGRAVGQRFMLNKLVRESGDAVGAWYAQQFVPSSEGLLELIWPVPPVTPRQPEECSRFFKSIDWAVMRRDFGPDAMTVACKAGMNDDPHHGHLDCGTFTLNWHGLSYIRELGRPEYDEKYFDELRWEYPVASSKGHNVVFVNGEEQLSAKLKDGQWKPGVGGKITQYRSEGSWGYVAMDPTRAYPGKDLSAWKRTIVLDKEHNVVILLDEVGCAKGSSIELRFHPGVERTVKHDRVVLHGRPLEPISRARSREGEGRREAARGDGPDLDVFSLFDGEWSIREGRQANIAITEESQFSWIPYFSTVAKAGGSRNVIATVFCPSVLRSPDTTAAQFTLTVKSGVPEVASVLAGVHYRYVFAQDQVTREVAPSSK